SCLARYAYRTSPRVARLILPEANYHRQLSCVCFPAACFFEEPGIVGIRKESYPGMVWRFSTTGPENALVLVHLPNRRLHRSNRQCCLGNAESRNPT